MSVKNKEKPGADQSFLPRLMKGAWVYGVTSVLVKASGLLIIPLFWKKLSPADFGVIAVFQILSQFLTLAFDLGLSGAVLRLYHEWRNDERAQCLGAIATFSFLVSGSIGLLLSLFLHSWLDLIFPNLNSSLPVVLGIWSGFLANYINIVGTLYRVRESRLQFSRLNLGIFITQTVFSLLSVYLIAGTAVSYLWGQMVGMVVMGLYCAWESGVDFKFNLNKKYLMPSLRYALPSAPATILDGANIILDRFFLQKFVPLSELGLYNQGRQLGGAYNMVLGILKNSFFPIIYKKAAEGDAKDALANFSPIYLFFVCSPALLAIAVGSDLVYLVGLKEYFPVAQYIPVVVLAYFFQGVGHAYGRGVDLAKRTNLLWVMHAVALSVLIGALMVLVPRFGVTGALWSFVFSFLFREVAQISLGYICFPRPTLWRQTLGTLVPQVLAAALILSIQFSSPSLSLLVKVPLALMGIMCSVLFQADLRGYVLRVFRRRVLKN